MAGGRHKPTQQGVTDAEKKKKGRGNGSAAGSGEDRRRPTGLQQAAAGALWGADGWGWNPNRPLCFLYTGHTRWPPWATTSHHSHGPPRGRANPKVKISLQAAVDPRAGNCLRAGTGLSRSPGYRSPPDPLQLMKSLDCLSELSN
jgi:hypothetical protein